MKRLAIFLDGTWNTLDNNTNVWRLKSLTAEMPDQRVYYCQGVGTRKGERALGGITGYGIDNEILDAYTWLVQNFEEGDELFIFGFSRGAYTARCLSGLICKCGILTLGAPLSIEQIYVRYRRPDATTIRTLLAGDLSTEPSLEERWLVKYSRPTKIRFLGVWDTVGQLGLPIVSMRLRIKKYCFLDTHLRPDNENAFHALALDEHRRIFEPTLWTRTGRRGDTEDQDRPIENVEQRWFVGAHANVGGGYASDPLAQFPLKWLMDKAAARGLVFRDQVEIDQCEPLPPIMDSYRDFAYGLYRFTSKPFFRPIGNALTTRRINETIDGSVFDRWRADEEYRPANLARWARRKSVDPAELKYAVLATNPQLDVE